MNMRYINDVRQMAFMVFRNTCNETHEVARTEIELERQFAEMELHGRIDIETLVAIRSVLSEEAQRRFSEILEEKR